MASQNTALYEQRVEKVDRTEPSSMAFVLAPKLVGVPNFIRTCQELRLRA